MLCTARQLIISASTLYLLTSVAMFWSFSQDPQVEMELRQAQTVHTPVQKFTPSDRCAILFWGLPRAYSSLVLPSVVHHILETNVQYNCDIFVHYFDLKEEAAGRSGLGGSINTDEIRLLKQAVYRVARKYYRDQLNETIQLPRVEFRVDTEEYFWTRYQALIDTIRNEKDPEGRYLYFPWKALTYKYPGTTDNIIKMWHTIQSAYETMANFGTRNNIQYGRIAMFRSDVVYVTPIDIWKTGSGQYDVHNQVAVVPGFGQYPVSDRMIYGPAQAVEVWATQRFSNLRNHVQEIYRKLPGWGLHSERFVYYSLFPAIQRLVKIQTHETLCFFRARSDETVWIQDCTLNPDPNVTLPTVYKSLGSGNLDRPRQLVENVLQRECGDFVRLKKPRVVTLSCKKDIVSRNN